jgi:xanthine/uracil permease
MTNETPDASNPVVFAAVFNQNWENVRHVKNERISFMNAYSLISAGVLTLLQNLHTSDVIRTALLLLMTLFSAFGFLTSLRLKAELEECLEKIGSMTTAAKVSEFVALGHLKGRPSHYPKFRWLFPVFFAMTTAGFITLILYRLFAGPPAA